MRNMLLFFKSFINTFSTLSWVDIVFFLAVMFLIILIVTLIYFIIINNDEEETEKSTVTKIEIKEKEEPKEEVTLFDDPNEEGELIDLKTLTKRLEDNKNDVIAMNDYEEEQEQKAIISYDELLASQKDIKINYEEEEQIGDLTVKKVDLDNISSPVEEPKKDYPKTISYEKEEAFLEALKKLQEQIN